jgi:hypothetical protein
MELHIKPTEGLATKSTKITKTEQAYALIEISAD